MYREIRSYANSIWDDNNNNNTCTDRSWEGETTVDYSSSTNILILVYFVHPIIWAFSLYINSGCGKREEHNNIWSMVMQGQHPLLELP